jgi:hypothetical protein
LENGAVFCYGDKKMVKQPRCKKCGRRLKSPLSVAQGMGPKCAGISSTSRRSVRVQTKISSSVAYSDRTPVHVQVPLITGELPRNQLSMRELIRRRKDERRRLFETRLPFQCGLVLPARKPLVYIPLDDGSWQENHSGKVISHERLQQYLVKYRFI